eukprot:TRINITY_DN7072_c0_g3_i5.p1 TRINITY_DN7072_c0_g3~~TRINITY_DN7072_c0_g3_i5.p1  ORF type:complete len:1087 (+),score=149.88 TRINITY_DN7072_c0_g3_i5:225-3485(+)
MQARPPSLSVHPPRCAPVRHVDKDLESPQASPDRAPEPSSESPPVRGRRWMWLTVGLCLVAGVYVYVDWLVLDRMEGPVARQQDPYTWGPSTSVQAYNHHPFAGQEALVTGHPARRSRLPSQDNPAGESSYEAIRVTAYPISQTGLSAAQQSFINNEIIPDAVEFLKQTLKVFPVSGNMYTDLSCQSWYGGSFQTCSLLPDAKCGAYVDIPSDHRSGKDQLGKDHYYDFPDFVSYPAAGAGVSATDFLLYVTSQAVGSCSANVLAFASSCSTDQYDRPVVGYANFCPQAIPADADLPVKGTTAYDTVLATALHEIVHAMGFAVTKYAFFRDHANGGAPSTARDSDSGLPTGGSGSVFSTSVYMPSTDVLFSATERGGTVWKLKTPTVLAKARAHFGCATLDGVEVENQGGPGTEASHWEKRLFNNEFMTGIKGSGMHQVYSDVTFALLQDSGWYYANWSSPLIESGKWLANVGCDAVSQKCLTPATNPSVVAGTETFFCTTSDSSACTYDGLARGFCGLSTDLSPLDASYQYYTASNTTGGSFTVADHCPFVRAYNDGDCLSGGQVNAEELIGSTSQCFTSTLRIGSAYAACYQTGCADGKVTITIGTSPSPVSVSCTVAGEALAVPGLTGVVYCPADVSYCPTPSPTLSPSGPSASPTTVAPTNAPTTESPSQAPTNAPSVAPTNEPTATPTKAPSEAPTKIPTNAPTDDPTIAPTKLPTNAPTDVPTNAPSVAPTNEPTATPTKAPSQTPTKTPTNAPTNDPTAAPTKLPTNTPTDVPTEAPTEAPSNAPRKPPTSSPVHAPSEAPTEVPTEVPTEAPTEAPSNAPIQATGHPLSDPPTQAPTVAPTEAPTEAPTDSPSSTHTPSLAPSKPPINAPTETPTEAPSKRPTSSPILAPSEAPANAPSKAPTKATNTPTRPPLEPPTEAPTPASGYTIVGQISFENLSRFDVLNPSFKTALVKTIAALVALAEEAITLVFSTRRDATVGYRIQAASSEQSESVSSAIFASSRTPAIFDVPLLAQLAASGYNGPAVGTTSVSQPTVTSNAGNGESSDDPLILVVVMACLLYTSPSPRDRTRSRMPSSA